jgi:hypothetical protein
MDEEMKRSNTWTMFKRIALAMTVSQQPLRMQILRHRQRSHTWNDQKSKIKLRRHIYSLSYRLQDPPIDTSIRGILVELRVS